jgi:hypothetical protein
MIQNTNRSQFINRRSITHLPEIASSDLVVEKRQSSSAEYWGRRLTIVVLVTWAASFVVGFQVALAILTVIGFGCAIIGFKRPVVALFGIGILCALDPLTITLIFTGGLLRWNTLSYWLLLVIAFSGRLLLRLRDPQTRLLQLLCLLLGLQILVSPEPNEGVQHVLNLITSLGILVYFARSAADDEAWYWLAIVIGILGAVGCPIFYLQASEFLSKINENNWAYFPLTGVFAICLGFQFSSQRPRGQLMLIMLAVANVGWIFLSGSRSRLWLGCICLIFLATRLRSIWHLLVAVFVAVLLGTVISTQFPTLQEHALERIGVLFDPTSSFTYRTSGRSDLAVAGWYIFRENPLGVGTGGCAWAWSQLDDLGGQLSFDSAIGTEKGAHAAWVKTVAENGFLGIVLLTGYVLSFAGAGLRTRNKSLIALGIFTTSALSVAFTSTEFQSKGLWFLAAGAMVLLHREEITTHLLRNTRSEIVASLRAGRSIRRV